VQPVPEQYQVCLSTLDTILKHAFEIPQTSDDNREKLQAMELFKNTHLVKLELLSNVTRPKNSTTSALVGGGGSIVPPGGNNVPNIPGPINSII
jgi:hypothetical protein